MVTSLLSCCGGMGTAGCRSAYPAAPITKSGRKLVTEVGDAGLPVIEAEARQAERWLAAAEAANREVIARHPVARQLGWQADGKTFVTAQDSPWRIEPRYSDQAAALTAHRPQGTLASWKEAIQDAENYAIVRAGLYAGLAAPLLVPLGLDSFTIDFSGKSTRGKTITAQVGLSCWADPSERSDGLFSWKTKIIGVEKRLNLVCGLPVVIDETRVVTSPDLVERGDLPGPQEPRTGPRRRVAQHDPVADHRHQHG